MWFGFRSWQTMASWGLLQLAARRWKLRVREGGGPRIERRGGMGVGWSGRSPAWPPKAAGRLEGSRSKARHVTQRMEPQPHNTDTDQEAWTSPRPRYPSGRPLLACSPGHHRVRLPSTQRRGLRFPTLAGTTDYLPVQGRHSLLQ